MLKPYTETQCKRIAANILAACSDINKLNNSSYKYLYLCSGFIAHYDLHGFRAHYDEPGTLARDITQNARANQWANFRPGDRDYAYYMSKRDIYNRILGGLAAYDFMRDHFSIVQVV